MGFTLKKDKLQRYCQDIDECKNYPGLCKGYLHCTNTVGSYVCGCREGYETVGTECIDINECSNSDICPEKSVCVNTGGSFICQCYEGYEGNLCIDIDECSNDSDCDINADCLNSGSCVYTIFILFSDRHIVATFTCEDPFSDGSFACSCQVGYYGDGRFCATGQYRMLNCVRLVCILYQIKSLVYCSAMVL